MIKRMLLAAFLFSMGLPLFSQSDADTTYVFRFVPGREMFYVPWGDNEESLDAILEALSANMEQLKNGERYINVCSYSPTPGDGLSPVRMSYRRSQRVKSELIIRGGATEEMFVTDRYTSAVYCEGMRDIVVVTFPASVEKVAKLAGAEAAAKVEAYNKEISGETERERLAAEAAAQREEQARAEAERLAAEQAARAKAEAERLEAEQKEKARLAAEEQARLQAEEESKAMPFRLALRANLLRWATLTPDLGVEWRINRHVGIGIDGTYTSWTWNNNDRRYALWEITPEVRYYLGKAKRGYIGAMYKAGAFDYKLSTTGKQGDLMGGGITGGYRMQLNKSFFMDFSLGLGYIHADYEKYVTIDGVRVTRGEESNNWWGPTHAGVTLVWSLF